MPKNLKKILPILALFFILVLFWPLATQAQFLKGMENLAGVGIGFFIKLAVALVTVLVILPVQAALLVFGAGIIIAGWMMEQTMNIPIVNSWARDIGWTFTRNLVNMLFIIILAWIGIATILRLREYRTGKILLNLLVIALLVNFSPVLVGLVVDASNIIAHYFISGIMQGFAFDCLISGTRSTGESCCVTPTGDPCLAGGVGIIEEASGQVWASFINAVNIFGGLDKSLINLGIILTYGVFFVLGAFIFALLALLFLFRVLAFWILLILSPFAFICFILPQTKGFWKMWWHQLLQWAFIGVTAAFFLWLAFAFLDATFDTRSNVNRFFGSVPDQDSLTPGFQIDCDPNTAGIQIRGCNPAQPNECASCPPDQLPLAVRLAQAGGGGAFAELFITVINSLLPIGVALVFMAISLFAGFSTGAMGASAVVNWGETKGKAWGLAAWGRGKRRGREELRKRMPEKVRKRMEEWSTAPPLRERIGARPTVPGKLGEIARAPTTWAKRRIGRISTASTEAQVSEIKQKEAEFMKINTEAELKGKVRTGPIDDRLAALSVGIEKGWMKTLDLEDKEIIKLAEEAAKVRPEIAEKILKANTHLSSQIAAVLSPEVREKLDLRWKSTAEQAKYGTLETKIAARLTTKEIPKLDIEKALADVNSKRAIIEFWKGAQLGAAAVKFEDSFVESYMEEVRKIHSTLRARGITGGYASLNPDAWHYIDTTAGRDFGFKRP